MFRITFEKNFLIGFALGAAGVAGVAVAVYLGISGGYDQSTRSSSARSSSRSDPDSIALEKLRIDIAIEVQAREELGARMAELDAKISELGRSIGEAAEGSLADNESLLESADSEESEGAGEAPSFEESSNSSRFDDAMLLSLGAHPSDVDRLHDRWARYELERAEISNRALREGWFDDPRHRAELIGSDLALRNELGDEDYDRFLYALDRPNRLTAKEVLSGSSASSAGLHPGDIIVRYDDVRVFSPGGLLVASSAGETGGSVALEILRDGRQRTLYIERGPLGVLLKHSRDVPLHE